MPHSIFSTISRSAILTLVQVAIAACWLLFMVAYALERSIDIPTHHLDGAYQTASGLFRLHAGHVPGRDFFPYLGIGPLYLLYPLFAFLGSHLAASVAAAHFLVLLACALCTSFLWHLVWRPASFLTSFVAGCAVYFLLYLVSIKLAVAVLPPLPDWLKFGASPGNSLRPLRAAAPYLALMIWFFMRIPTKSPGCTDLKSPGDSEMMSPTSTI